VADPITLALDDRDRWASEAGDAVEAAAADVRRRMGKALAGKKVPARARSVFRASWWDQAVDRHVAPTFDRIAGEAATAARQGSDPGDVSRQALDMLAERTDTVRSRVRDLHTQAVRERWPADRLATELGVRGGSGPMSANSARAIGRGLSTTVVQGAAHQALTGAVDMGAVTKVWHCAFLPNSRAEHRAANGQTVKLDEPFTVAGHDAMYPGDRSLPVAQTAGCHCWVTYETVDGEVLRGGDAWTSVPSLRKKDFTTGQWDAIGEYIGARYLDINGALRSAAGGAIDVDADDDLGDVITNLDAAIAKVTLAAAVEVWRGFNRWKPELGEGAEYVDWGYESTTTDATTAAQFYSTANTEGVVTLLRIGLPAGSTALPVSGEAGRNLGESELILPRGQTYRITGETMTEIGANEQVRVLDVEIVAPAVTASAGQFAKKKTTTKKKPSAAAVTRMTMDPDDVEVTVPAPDATASTTASEAPMATFTPARPATTFAVPTGRVVVTVEPTAAEKQAFAAFADLPAELHVPLLDVGDVASLTPDARTALAGALSTVAAVTPPLSGTVSGTGWLEAEGVTVGLVDCPGLGDLRALIADLLADMAPEPGEFIPTLVLTAGSVDATQIAGTPLHFNELRVRAGGETLVFDLLGPIPGAPEPAAPEPETAPDPEPPATDEPPPAEPLSMPRPLYGHVIPVPESAPPEELPAMTTTSTTFATGTTGTLTVPAGWRLVPDTAVAHFADVLAPGDEAPAVEEPPAPALADATEEDLEAEIARRAAEQAATAAGVPAADLLADALEEVAGIVSEVVAELEASGEPADEGAPADAPPFAEAAETFAGELAPDVDSDGIGETPAAATDYEWEGILAIEDTPTSDGRMFAAGALVWRTLPLTLSLQTVTAPGHDGGVICGSICEIERVGNNIIGRGKFSSTEAGELARTLIGEGSLHGVSIDVASAIVVYTNEDGDEIEVVDAMFGEPATAVFVEAEMMGAHLTPFPAFADARVDLLNAPTSLVATAAPGTWRLSGPAFFRLLDGETTTDALVASAAPTILAPPAALFSLKPDTTHPFSVGTPLADGTVPVYGLLADWNIPHIGHGGRKVYPPRGDDFATFYTGKHVTTREGDRIPTGPIFIDTVHPNLAAQASDAQAFYAHTGAAVADVHLYNGEHGIVAAGVLRPDVDELAVRRFAGSDVSPDWRWVNGRHRMVAILAVNASGFPVPYVEGIAASAGQLRSWVSYNPAGEPLAMVAVGAPVREHRPANVVATLQAQVEDNARRLAAMESKIQLLSAATFATTDPFTPKVEVAAEDGPVELSAEERAARARAALATLGLDRESRARRARASLGILEPVG
jgi:hypothetical protein